jgi:hypothetical protein
MSWKVKLTVCISQAQMVVHEALERGWADLGAGPQIYPPREAHERGRAVVRLTLNRLELATATCYRCAMTQNTAAIEALNQDLTDEYIYEHYKTLGGQMPLARFKQVLEAFGLITVDAFCSGEGSDLQRLESELRDDIDIKQVAVDQWLCFMGRIGHDAEEAERIADAVANFDYFKNG